MIITLVIGARPNFIKIAPIIKALSKRERLQCRLVHTGQHFDEKMSDTFFKQLNIPIPDINLGCGSGTQAEQCAAIMIAFEKDLKKNPANLVLVVGDVNSTMACSIVAKKEGVKVAHVEAGIRSGDMSMPEEINRIVTDSITDYFFTTTPWAGQNLEKGGISRDRIFWVGNVMVDSLLANMGRLRQPSFWDNMRLEEKEYLVMTMHRPANVDEVDKLKSFMEVISVSARNLPVIFPMHPRTKRIFEGASISFGNIHPVEPLGYLEFNYLVKNSLAVITDSGGITEETTVMGIPCLTLRDNTERPETVELGTNELVGTNPNKIPAALERVLNGTWKKGRIPEKWDGKAAERIVDILSSIL